MSDIVDAILKQPIGTILIILGALFFAVAAVRQLKEWFKLDGLGRASFYIAGVILIFLGLSIHLSWIHSGDSPVPAEPQVDLVGCPPAIPKLCEEASHWPVSISDDFTDNRRKWTSEKRSSQTGGWNLFIERRYRWELFAKSLGLLTYGFPDGAISVHDGYIGVEAQELRGRAERSGFGIMFRVTYNAPHTNGYEFLINNVGEYALNNIVNDEPGVVIPWTQAKVIRPGEVNRLGVVLQGQTIALFLNGHYVNMVTNPNVTDGMVGLVAHTGSSDNSIIEYDNLIVRVPR